MIIDCHHHLMDEEGYADSLAEECRRLDIGKVFLMALPDYCGGFAGNEATAEAVRKYPDLFVGFGGLKRGASPCSSTWVSS